MLVIVFRLVGFLAPFELLGFILTMSHVPDKGYSGSASCALN